MGHDKQALTLWEFGRCVALVAVKDLLRGNRNRDMMSQSRVTGKILASTWSSDLVFGSLGLGQASFDLEA